MEFPDLAYERKLWKKNVRLVAGIDEAGRGAWAGPVTAAAVILPGEPAVLRGLQGVRDSKQLSARQREHWALRIKKIAVFWAVGFASHGEIDRLGILPATRLAMQRAVSGLKQKPQHLLIDAVRLSDVGIPQTSLIRGDVHVLSIACASILAKTARDAKLRSLAVKYPDYGFERHKGYGTAFHQQALKIHGACPSHRFSFAPIRDLKTNIPRMHD
jgi:ribonuclease HII